MDLRERDRIYRDLAEIFHTEMPATFLYPKVDWYASNRRLRGIGSGDLMMRADRLWVEAER